MNRKRPSRRAGHGFTLTELLVVMVIIVFLIGLIFGAIRGAMHAAAVAAAKADVKNIVAAVNAYRSEYGSYPPGVPNSGQVGTYNTSLMNALMGNNPKKMVFLVVDSKRFNEGSVEYSDPWGDRYYISTTTGNVRVWSEGPDGADNTADDIRSW